jgi:hypothetical protein
MAGVPGGDDPQDDPFAGSVLGADFIAGAPGYEAPARTCVAVARYGARQRAGHSESARRPPRLHRAKLLWSSAVPLAVGLVVFVGAGCSLFGPADRPPADSAPGPSATSTEPPTLNNQRFTRGHCYTWDQHLENTTADDVDCGKPHLFEAVDKTNIAADYPHDSEFPTEAQWDKIADHYCLPIIGDFLGHPLDPYGRFGPALIQPVRLGWKEGDRALVCGMGATSVTAAEATAQAADPNRFVAFTGKVEGAEQALVYPLGTCLEMTETEVKGPVACDAPHQAEATGAATLPDTADGKPPSDDTIGIQAEPKCTSVAKQFLGRSVRQADGEQVSWLLIAPESWQAGTRKLTCTIQFVDAEGRLATRDHDLRR